MQPNRAERSSMPSDKKRGMNRSIHKEPRKSVLIQPWGANSLVRLVYVHGVDRDLQSSHFILF